jgi:hypothetical protein
MLNRLALIAALAASACAEKAPPPQFPVTFTADADGEPLAGVKLKLGDRELGTTGKDGTLHLRLTGREGAAVPVQATCPEGYRQPEKPPVVKLQRFKGLDPVSEARGIEIGVPCVPEERSAVVVVRTTTPNLPILARGQVIGTTDENGIAHGLLKLSPNTTFRLVIDTSSDPMLRPQNPATTLTLSDADEIFVVNKNFTVEQKPTKKKKKKKKKVVVKNNRPTQIYSTRRR